MIDKVEVENAVGLTLAHDVTRIIPGGSKGPAFRRGHIIREEDIPQLLDIGKEHVFVLRLEEGEVHEEEAALRIAQAVAGPDLALTRPKEGRVDLIAEKFGVARINVPVLDQINMLGEIVIATVHSGMVCEKGRPVAGMRIIPLFIADRKLALLEEIAGRQHPPISLLPIHPKRIGLIVTGNEVFKGRIKDGFSPIVHRKVEALGSSINNEAVVPDDPGLIARTILDFQTNGSDIIVCCSGMSVDPDDVTAEGIRQSGAQVRFYGLPVLPGAMFLYAKLGNTPILGAPACVIHDPATAFDVLFPLIVAGEDLTYEDTRRMGHGGLCLHCDTCAYPVCPYCK